MLKALEKPVAPVAVVKPEAPKRNATWVKPVALRRLADLVGQTAAAAALGLSDSAISKSLTTDKTRLINERGAKDALREMDAAQEEAAKVKSVLIVGLVPEDRVAALVAGAQFVGVDLMNLGEV